MLDEGENKVGTTVVSRYDYCVNLLGQRTGVSKKGTAFVGRQAEWAWKCDALGEAIGADDADTPAAAFVSGSQQGAGGVGGLVLWSRTHNSGASWQSFYPCYDGNGNVTELLDSAGDIAAHWQYDPFGNTIASSPAPVNWASPVAHFPYRFSTKPLDFDLGMYYYGYRWYDPVTGRWPSRDPIEERGGVNLYGFVGNDGVNSIDMFGLVKVNFLETIDLPDIRPQGLIEKVADKDIAYGNVSIDFVCNNGTPSPNIAPRAQKVTFNGPDKHVLGIGGTVGPVNIGGAIEGGWYGEVHGRNVTISKCKETGSDENEFILKYVVYIDIVAYEELTGNAGIVLTGQGAITLNNSIIKRRVIQYTFSCCCKKAKAERGASWDWQGLISE